MEEVGNKWGPRDPDNRILKRLAGCVGKLPVGHIIDLDELAEMVGTRKNPLHPSAVSGLLRVCQREINDNLHGPQHPEGAGHLVCDRGRWAVAQIVRRYPDQHTVTDTNPELNTMEGDDSGTSDVADTFGDKETAGEIIAPKPKEISAPNRVDQSDRGDKNSPYHEGHRQTLGVLNKAGGAPMSFSDIRDKLRPRPDRQEFRGIVDHLKELGLIRNASNGGGKACVTIDPYARPLLAVSGLAQLENPSIFFEQCKEFAEITTPLGKKGVLPSESPSSVSPILFGLCEGYIGDRDLVDLNELAEAICVELNRYRGVDTNPEQVVRDIMTLTGPKKYIKAHRKGGRTTLSIVTPEGDEGLRRQRLDFYKKYPFIEKFKNHE